MSCNLNRHDWKYKLLKLSSHVVYSWFCISLNPRIKLNLKIYYFYLWVCKNIHKVINKLFEMQSLFFLQYQSCEIFLSVCNYCWAPFNLPNLSVFINWTVLKWYHFSYQKWTLLLSFSARVADIENPSMPKSKWRSPPAAVAWWPNWNLF